MLYDLTDSQEYPGVAGVSAGSVLLELPVWAPDNRSNAGSTWRLWQQLQSASEEDLLRLSGASILSKALVRRARRALFQRCIAIVENTRARASVGVHTGAEADSKGPPATAATIIYSPAGVARAHPGYGDIVSTEGAAAVLNTGDVGVVADGGADPFFAFSPSFDAPASRSGSVMHSG